MTITAQVSEGTNYLSASVTYNLNVWVKLTASIASGGTLSVQFSEFAAYAGQTVKINTTFSNGYEPSNWSVYLCDAYPAYSSNIKGGYTQYKNTDINPLLLDWVKCVWFFSPTAFAGADTATIRFRPI